MAKSRRQGRKPRLDPRHVDRSFLPRMVQLGEIYKIVHFQEILFCGQLSETEGYHYMTSLKYTDIFF